MTNDAPLPHDRIESALARIDRALAQPRRSTPDLAHKELAARHDTLRAEARRAIAELDALIGRGG